MNELYNKKELKKQSRDFRVISSRTLTSDFQMFGNNLKRLINYIDNNEIIKKYIDSCISENDNFKIEDDVNQVCGSYDYIFDTYIEEQQEVSYIYQILKYIVENNKDCRAYTMSYSYSKQYQDKLKGFCDNVVEPFVNHIDSNYERIFIEMGFDEETKFEIINNGGQVNLVKDNGVLNAIQLNNSKLDNLVQNIKEKINEIEDEEVKKKELKEEVKNEIIDNIEGIQEELNKADIKKGRIKSFISALKDKLSILKSTIEVCAAITELITFAQQFIK